MCKQAHASASVCVPLCVYAVTLEFFKALASLQITPNAFNSYFFHFPKERPPVEKQEKCLSGCFHGRTAEPHPAPCLFSSCHGVWLSGDQRQDVWWHSSASSPWSWGKLFMKWVQIIICCGRIVLPCQKPESVGQLVGRLAQAISARSVGSMCRTFRCRFSKNALLGLRDKVLGLGCLVFLTSGSDRLGGSSLSLLASCMHWAFDMLADSTDSWIRLWTSTGLLLAELSVTLILYPLSYHPGLLIGVSSANMPLKVFASFLAVCLIMDKYRSKCLISKLHWISWKRKRELKWRFALSWQLWWNYFGFQFKF